jgi:hypothetical protein
VPNQDSFPAAGENPDVSKHRRVDGEDRRISTVVVEKLRTFEVTHTYIHAYMRAGIYKHLCPDSKKHDCPTRASMS